MTEERFSQCPKCKHDVDNEDIIYEYIKGRDWCSPTHQCNYCHKNNAICGVEL